MVDSGYTQSFGIFQSDYSFSAFHQLSADCLLKLNTNRSDVLRSNLLKQLPLPKTAMSGRRHPPVATYSKPVKRKRIRSDIYDSEVSDDETVQQCHAETCQEEDQKSVSEADSDLETEAIIILSSGEARETETAATVVPLEGGDCAKRGSRKCTDDGLDSRLLGSFGRYAESLSDVDGHHSQQAPLGTHMSGGWSLLPGIEDAASREDQKGKCDRLREVKAEVGVRASTHIWKDVDSQVSSWKDDTCSDQLPSGCSIPVPCPGTSSSEEDFTSDETTARLAFLLLTCVKNEPLERKMECWYDLGHFGFFCCCPFSFTTIVTSWHQTL